MRIHVSLWPGQNWVIDQQLLPRMRELFAKESIEIPGDRIVSFYHVRQEQTVRTLGSRLYRAKRRKNRKSTAARIVEPSEGTPKQDRAES